jgi:hypothetical protein
MQSSSLDESSSSSASLKALKSLEHGTQINFS